jgi:uncharacterized protein YjbJ (UPF0337 family)
MINENILKGSWKEIKGDLQKKWGQLTDDELDQVQGSAKALEGLMQKKLGFQQDRAQSELNDFLDRWTKSHPSGSELERDF